MLRLRRALLVAALVACALAVATVGASADDLTPATITTNAMSATEESASGYVMAELTNELETVTETETEAEVDSAADTDAEADTEVDAESESESESEALVDAEGNPFSGLAAKMKSGAQSLQAKAKKAAPKIVKAIKDFFSSKKDDDSSKGEAKALLNRALPKAKAAAASALQAATTPAAATGAASAAAAAPKSRRSRQQERAQKLAHFGARVADPIPEPFPRKTPTPLKAGEVSTTQCTDEGRRRIAMCIRILGAFALPNEKNEIIFTEKAVLGACANAYSSSADQLTCAGMHAHILSVADLRQLSQAMRNEDAHNSCVKLLGTSVNGQAWIAQPDAEQCYLSHIPERQNEGVTGSRCLFLHGSGVTALSYDELNTLKGDYDGFLTDYPAYWAGVSQQVGGSCDKRFYVTETTTRGWDDGTLQEEYCRAIRNFQPHTIFAHSTANNVLAAAIANAVPGCETIVAQGEKVKAGQSVWFGMNAPLAGSPLVDSLKSACAKAENQDKAWFAGVCARQYAMPYYGFGTLETAYINKAAVSLTTAADKYGRAQFDCAADGLMNHFEEDEPIRRDCISLASVAAKYMSGSLCGVAPDAFSTTPRRTLAQSPMNFLGGDKSVTVEWGRDAVTEITREKIRGHDGLVPFASCRVVNRTYVGDASSAFYVTRTNLDDGRCANGEGTAADQKPCSWITNRLAEGVARFASLQNFKAGSTVNRAPGSAETAPGFSSFKYDAETLTAKIRAQLDVQDAKTQKAQPVLKVAAKLSRKSRRAAKAAAAQAVESLKEQVAEAQRRKKIAEDSDAQETRNNEAYEKAMAA